MSKKGLDKTGFTIVVILYFSLSIMLDAYGAVGGGNKLSEKDNELLYRYAYKAGNKYFELKDYTKALFYYEMAFESGDKKKLTGQLLYNIGLLYKLKKEYEKALTYYKLLESYKSAVEGDKLILKGYYEMGDVYNGLKDYTKALIYYKKAKGLEDDIILVKISQIYLKQKDYEVAEGVLKGARKRRVLKPKGYDVKENRFKRERGKNVRKKNVRKKNVRKKNIRKKNIKGKDIKRKNVKGKDIKVESRHSGQILEALGDVYKAMGREEEAIRYYKDALNSLRFARRLYTKLGHGYVSLKRYKEASDNFKKAYNLGRDRLVLEGLSHALIEQKEYRKAIEVLKGGIEGALDVSKNIRLLLGIAYYRNKQYNYALRYLIDLIRSEDGMEGLLPMIGYALFNIKDYTKAIFYYKWALETNSRSLEFREKLALSYFKMGSYYLSGVEFLRLIELGKNDGLTFLRLAQSYMGIKEYAKANKVLNHIRARFVDYEKEKIRKYQEEISKRQKLETSSPKDVRAK